MRIAHAGFERWRAGMGLMGVGDRFDIYDTCTDPNIAVRNSVYFIATQDSKNCESETSPQSIAAVVGPTTSSAAVSVASLFNLFTLPEVSYAATSEILSESRFKYFTRTVPTDTFQARAMAHLVHHFDFHTVALIGNDEGAYGVSGVYMFEDEASKFNICIAYQNIFGVSDDQSDFEEIVNDLRKIPDVRVIVAFANEAPMSRLLNYFAEHNVTGYMWIGSDGWGASKTILDPRISRVTNGMIGVFPHTETITGFEDYILNLTPEALDYQDPFLNEYWQEFFQCYLPGISEMDVHEYGRKCTEEESFYSTRPFSNTSLVSSVVDSVEVVARAMHTILNCDDGQCDSREDVGIPGEVLIEGMKNVDFMGHSGYRLSPNERGNLAGDAWYDFYNLQPKYPCSEEFHLKVVGFWKEADVSISNLEKIYWPMTNTCTLASSRPRSICGETCYPGTRRISLDISSCCWICVPCSNNHFSNESNALSCFPCGDEQISNEDRTECLDLPYAFTELTSKIGLGALAIAIIGWLICVAIVIIFMLKENTTIIFHAFARSWSFVLLGIAMTFFTATLSVIPASELTCLIVAGTQLLPVSITEGSLILAAYCTFNKKHVQLNNWVLFMIAILFVHGQCILVWMLTSRPVVTKTVDRDHRLVYVDCVSSGSYDGIVVVITYCILLDIIGIFVSFNIRNRDKNFQEGKFIFFSFIIQVMVWVTIMVIYLVLPSGRLYRTFVLSFGLMVSSVANLGCLFVPKLYVLKCKPDINPPIKKRYRDKLWQWKFKRRDGEDEVTAEARFGESIRSHAARSAILNNYRKALAAIRDETAQAIRMYGICNDRIDDMKLRHRRKMEEVSMTTNSIKSSRVQLVLSSPSIEVTYC
nr:extracellular calcium-sensing receptor-like [Lytechinus pictus]